MEDDECKKETKIKEIKKELIIRRVDHSSVNTENDW